MMKRVFSTLLVFVFTLGMLFLTAPRAQAAPLSTSEDAIQFIKSWEGFSAKAYWDVTQWTVGYGTAGKKGQTMTVEQADKAMRDHLAKVDTAINEFAAAKGLNLTQSQHDALASFSFNCGTVWMRSSGRFVTALTSKATGNDFLFAISLWSNVAGNPDVGVLRRRLSEANIYLNDVYSKSLPADYTYVIFDANGGVNGHGGEDKMQGYITAADVPILAADPTRTGYEFSGWYTARTGGTKVIFLSDAVRGKALFARWGAKVTVTQDANVRSGAGTANGITGSVRKGQKLTITDVVNVNGAAWGQFEDGWLALMYTDFKGTASQTAQPASSVVIDSGTVSCDTYVNIRKGAGTGNAVIGTVTNGTAVSIYEKTTVSGRPWGRTADGWICLDYVTLSGSQPEAATESTEATAPSEEAETTAPSTEAPVETTEAPAETAGAATEPTTAPTVQPTEPAKTQTGTKATVNADGLNVRSAAGTGSKRLTTLNKGTKVTVYEQVTKDAAPWGRIDQGWVCMYYIDLPSAEDQTTQTPVSTGKVSSTTGLNVRSAPDASASRVAALKAGTAVSVYETKTVDGQPWGRIGKGQWICLTYVKLDSTQSSKPAEQSPAQTKPAEVTKPAAPVQQNTKGEVKGSVSSSTALNVRAGAGTTFPVVGMVDPGTEFTIYEQSNADGYKWGRIGQSRWVCMSYVTLGSQSSTAAAKPIATGKVKSTTNLNVRSGAGTANPLAGKLKPGTEVTIYETQKVGSTLWGRIDTGWISTNYVEVKTGSLK